MNDNLVEMLREKTEEADLNSILKSTLGGYSRKSVQAYITILRQQQSDMKLSFSAELERVQAERDHLLRELAEARNRAEAAEEALENAQTMMEKAAGLEKDMEEAVERIQADAVRLEEQKSQIDALRAELAQVSAPQVPAAEGLVEDAPADEVQSMPAGEEDAQDKPVGVLDLMNRPETMQIQLAMLTRERETTANRMAGILRQQDSLFDALAECRSELEARREQSEWMEAENNELSRRLSEQIGQNIALNREIVHIKAVNETLRRRLDARQQ